MNKLIKFLISLFPSSTDEIKSEIYKEGFNDCVKEYSERCCICCAYGEHDNNLMGYWCKHPKGHGTIMNRTYSCNQWMQR